MATFTQGATVVVENSLLFNEFYKTLWGMVGRVEYANRSTYENKWEWPKKGKLENGDKIEQIYVGLADIHNYNGDDQSYPLVGEKPDIQATFHKINYQKYYKTRWSDYEAQTLMLTAEGFMGLVYRIIDSLYTSANYDEYLTYKFITAREIVTGQVFPTSWDADATEGEKSALILETMDNMEYISSNMNRAGVPTWTPNDRKHLIMTNKFAANRDVNFLASVFNLDKAEIADKYNKIDSFGFTREELARLDEIFSDENGVFDKDYVRITAEQNEILKTIPAVAVDEDFYQVYDAIISMEFREAMNPQNLNRYAWLHIWRILATSPYHNITVFVEGENGLSAIDVSKLAYDADKGGYTTSAPANESIADTGYTGVSTSLAVPFAVISQGTGLFPEFGEMEPTDVSVKITSEDPELVAAINAGLITITPATGALKNAKVFDTSAGTYTGEANSQMNNLAAVWTLFIDASVRQASGDYEARTATIKVAYREFTRDITVEC